MISEFNDLNLNAQLVQAVTELGYTSPTPIQTAVIPVMLTGQDIIGQAQTGTGKTASFSLPILHNLDPEQESIQSLIMAPTRELAIQVAKTIREYGRHLNIKVLAVYGGQPYRQQTRYLKKGVDIVVGTPGRLLDLIKRKDLNLNSVKIVTLDEADEMLSMGFIEDIEAILKEIPENRQTALFSATLPREIRRLANRYMQNPEAITIKQKQLTVATIKQSYYLVNEADKLAALTRLFEVEDITSAIIFTRTRAGTGELANELVARGFPAEALNGDLSQEARTRVLNRFRHNQIKVLVATDVAARGLDIDDISHVFNYDIPLDPEVYVHRIGRTGRVGKEGAAISLLPPKEFRHLRRIEVYTRQKISSATVPTIEEIKTHREEKLLKQISVWLQRDRCQQEKEIVTKLIAEGHDAVEIAAVALKLARAEEKQRPIAPMSKVKEPRFQGARYGNGNRSNSRQGYRQNYNQDFRSRHNGKRETGKRETGKREHGRREYGKREAEMVQLSFSKGKTHGVRPNDVVGTIAYHSGIPGHTIGKINIQAEKTLVDVPKNLVAQVLAKTDSYRIHKQAITVEQV